MLFGSDDNMDMPDRRIFEDYDEYGYYDQDETPEPPIRKPLVPPRTKKYLVHGSFIATMMVYANSEEEARQAADNVPPDAWRFIDGQVDKVEEVKRDHDSG